MHQHSAPKQSLVKRNQMGVMRQAVEAFQFLHIVISGVGHPNIQTHVAFGHLAERLGIDKPAMYALPRLTPARMFHYSQSIRAHPKDIFGGKQAPKEQIALIFGATAKRIGIA